jgi:hypothetical protein
MLTWLVSSQQPCPDLFRVVACAARCAMLTTSFQLISHCIQQLRHHSSTSRHLQLASMASWLVSSTLHLRSDAMRVSIAPRAYPIVFVAVEYPPAVPITLDDSRRLLLVPMASWVGISTRQGRFAIAIIHTASGMLCATVGVAWYGCFTALFIWILSRSPW